MYKEKYFFKLKFHFSGSKKKNSRSCPKTGRLRNPGGGDRCGITVYAWAGRRGGHRERGVWPSDVGWPEHPLPLCLHRLPFHYTHPNPRGGREDTITKIDIKNNLVYMLSPISCCYYKIININTITIT